MSRTKKSALCALFLICSAASALADGGMFRRVGEGRADELVASPTQEAVLLVAGGSVQVILRTHFRPGPEQVAWLVPVPARPTGIAPHDPEIFAKLQQLTAPRFQIVQRNPGKTGCGCHGGGPGGAGISTVAVAETGSAGIYDYAVLTAADPQDLVNWLNDNEFAVPASTADAVASYVDRGWHWLAIRLRPEQSDAAALAPHPITYRYKSQDVIYPLIISRISADRENEILLYVVANRRYEAGNWRNRAIDSQELRYLPSSPSLTNYEQLFRRTVERHGHVFVTEASLRFWNLDRNLVALESSDNSPASGSWWVTRLRTIVTAEQMDRDVELIPARRQQRIFPSRRIEVGVDDPITAALPFGVFSCLVAGLFLRQRPAGRRIGSIVLLLVAAAWIAI